MQTLDATRWVSQTHPLGFAGFRCTECGKWRGASEFLICLCNDATQYVIASQQNGEQVWWNNDEGWTQDFTEATTFGSGILTLPLPMGATGILELTLTGEHVRFLPTPSPVAGA